MNSHQPAGRRAGLCSKAAGFTLVEMLAVMIIIALLAALTLAGMSVASRTADIARARADMERIKNSVADNQLTGTPVLSLTDPWGTSYQCTTSTNGLLSVWSYGPDKTSNTPDDIIY
ncbi:MAG: prepilin-type N-terminal cleavage/methylation domain-containing protein [Kiritimatiellaeota bacterium]|nr:prepilin-type N-terminal cleavage/methylation domain-containing protein [Kiritimatiellota bacterium]